MKCVKCGMDLEDNAKFCGNCGSVVESVQNDQPAFSSEVSNIQEERQEIVQEPIPVDTAEFKQQQENGKKSSGAIKYILLIVILLAVAAASVFVYFKFFANKESYEKSINTLEKSMKNLVKQDMDSATITAKVELEASSMSVNFGAAVEFEKTNNSIKLHAKVDKNIMTDKIDLYAALDNNSVTAYMPNSLFKLMGMDMSELGINKEYIKYTMPLDGLDIDLDEIKSEIKADDTDLGLSKVFTKDSFKYVGEKDGIKKYTLTVDKNYINNLKKELKESDVSLDELKDLENIGDMKFDINLYIDSQDRLVLLELDLTKALKEELKESGENVKKALISIGFSEINTTKVEVPASVERNSFDFSQYMELDYTNSLLEDLSSDVTLPATSKLF